MNSLTVIGVGSRLRGDDAIGPLVIDMLSRKQDPRLELVDAGSDALGILEHLEDREHVLVVDACSLGQAPGYIEVFAPDQVDLILKADPLSLHGLGLSEALKLAESLDLMPGDLKIIGIEPESIQFNGSLSAPLKRALKRVVQIIQDELMQAEQLAKA